MAGKFVLLVLCAAGILAVATATSAVSSLVAGSLTAGAGGTAGADWGDAVIVLVKSWLALWPYVALAGFITTLTTSSAAGMAVALGYLFAEQIAVTILMSVFDWFQTVSDYVLGRNINAWMLGDQRQELGSGAAFGIQLGEYPGDVHSFLVMAAYTLALAGLAFWVFQRRDAGGARGG